MDGSEPLHEGLGESRRSRRRRREGDGDEQKKDKREKIDSGAVIDGHGFSSTVVSTTKLPDLVAWPPVPASPPPPTLSSSGTAQPLHHQITQLPSTLTRSTTGLTKSSLSLLLSKQAWLRENRPFISFPQFPPPRLRSQSKSRKRNLTNTSSYISWSNYTSPTHSQSRSTDQSGRELGKEKTIETEFQTALSATLLFASADAGTAVCIHPSGLLLTCAHCVVEDQKSTETKGGKDKIGGGEWLLFASGLAVQARIVSRDERSDLALLRIIAAQLPTSPSSSEGSLHPSPTFPYLELSRVFSSSPPPVSTSLLCVGQPGAEDLEAPPRARPSMRPVKTGYDVLHVSGGVFRGYAPDVVDVCDNSEIGALMHDCWTYWGHSGAPLVALVCEAGDENRVVVEDGDERGETQKGQLRARARLVGLHSSWDDHTGMRRGIGWECLRRFLENLRSERIIE